MSRIEEFWIEGGKRNPRGATQRTRWRHILVGRQYLELVIRRLDARRPFNYRIPTLGAPCSERSCDCHAIGSIGVNGIKPARRRHVDFWRNHAGIKGLEHAAGVRSAVAETLIEARLRKVVVFRAIDGTGQRVVDVIGGLPENLHRFVGRKLEILLAGVGVQKPRHPGGLLRRLARTGGRRNRKRHLAAEVRTAVKVNEPIGVVANAVNSQCMVRRRRHIVMPRVFVGHARDDQNVLIVRVVDRRPRRGGLIDAPEGDVEDRRPVVGRKDSPFCKVGRIADVALPGPHRKDPALRADPDPAEIVVPLGGDPFGLTVSVSVAGVVVGVVVVVEKVPTGNVVLVAVGVIVDTLRKCQNQIAGIENTISIEVPLLAVGSGNLAFAVGEAGFAGDRPRHPWVVGVVSNVEDAVPIAIKAGQVFRIGTHAAIGLSRSLRAGQLGSVEDVARDQVLVFPVDAGVEDGDDDVIIAGRLRPCFVDVHAARPKLLVEALERRGVRGPIRKERPVVPVAGVVGVVRPVCRVLQVGAGGRRPCGMAGRGGAEEKRAGGEEGEGVARAKHHPPVYRIRPVASPPERAIEGRKETFVSKRMTSEAVTR
ncbi:hypothetical protein OUZ56_032427 [Daphnia magna]|uniref:Uncharacterized protein n=1 Tax=Daphnia magna TaxID=35525 RepID=A0ABR0B8V1_9CRUS|nr:hypothetical protein OUZ56_032427 [Daphnia magna]